MAMLAGFEHKIFEKHFIEWTFTIPDEDSSDDSKWFRIWDAEYYLRFRRSAKNSGDNRLFFRTKKIPEIFRMEVYLYSGTSSMPRQNCNVTDADACIWSCSADEMLKFVPNVQKGHLLRFVVHIQCGEFPKEIFEKRAKKDDKSVQTLTHSDSHVYFETLSQDLERIFEDGSSHDVEIKCDNQTFKAHKLLLGSRSEVFAAMLQSNMVEGKTGKVTIEDMEASVFKPFLRYLYSGKLPELSVDMAKRLYEAGDKYAVQGLRKKCASFLTHNLTEDNACDVMVLADSRNDPQLKESVTVYILDKKIPLKDSHWPDFADRHPKLAVEVYKRFCKVHTERLK